MKNINIRKKLASLLMAGTTIVLSACSNYDEYEPVEIVPIPIVYEDEKVVEEESIEETVTVEEEQAVEEIKEVHKFEGLNAYLNDIENADKIGVVVALVHTRIMSEKEDGELLGVFAEGRNFQLLSSEDEKWYTIQYYNKIGYVKKEDCFQTELPVMISDMVNKGYLPNGGYVYKTKELGNGDESLDNVVTKLNELEFAEIYEENEDSYLIQTTDNVIGYVKKDDIMILEGVMAVTDISNQEVRLYEGNELTLIAPCVTGMKGTRSETVQALTRYLTVSNTPGWITSTAHVECVAYFNERSMGHHTCLKEDAKGWRNSWELGGVTWEGHYFALTGDGPVVVDDIETEPGTKVVEAHGSHGCVNMPTEEAKYLCKTVHTGDYNLVKE